MALARALVKRPKLLLLDEPLGALDKKLREETQFELVKIQETLGVTFIVVTHDQEEAMTLSTRIGVMNHGRDRQIGEPHRNLRIPNSRFVADFIGSVNMFEGASPRTSPTTCASARPSWAPRSMSATASIAPPDQIAVVGGPARKRCS